MKAPPLFLATSLLVWGWQVEQLGLAVSLALLLEASRLLRWRWPLGDKAIYRLVDGCAVLLIVFASIGFWQQTPTNALFVLLEWLPPLLFPVVAVQYMSDRERIPLAALSLQQRRRGPTTASVDISYPYFVICLISASTGNQATVVFYLAVASLWTWALWQHRNTHHNPGVWAALVLMAGSGGYLGHGALMQLQGALMEQMPAWLWAWLEPAADPYRRSTAMGAIGRLKQSDRIILRVAPGENNAVPELLHKASYNVFQHNTWFVSTATERFQPLETASGKSWKVAASSGAEDHSARISYTFKKSRDLVPVPLGTYQIRELPAQRLARNPLGTLQAHIDSDFVIFTADYGPAPQHPPPRAADLKVPESYREVLKPLAKILELRQHPPAKAVNSVQRYFDTHFSYSLELTRGDSALPPLTDFLRNTRAGHCEYFASATVLLLRQAGIPARYVSGYSVQEYSPLERQFVVRQRHAHAWAVAYVDGRWRNVDTTPANWAEIDARQSSFITPLYDLLAWAWLNLQASRSKPDPSDLSADLAWLLIPLGLVLSWRLGWHRRFLARHDKNFETPTLAPADPGTDSECYRLIDWYHHHGIHRQPHQTLKNWLLTQVPLHQRHSPDLVNEIVALHYRYRFDPAGLNGAEREQLSMLVQQWLEKH